MKRLTAIIRGENLVGTLERRSNRIMRQVEQAIDAAKDAQAEVEDKIEESINALGLVSGADQTAGLQRCLNNCIDLFAERDSCASTVGYLEIIKAKLNEEVEVEESENASAPVKTKSVKA